MRTDVSIDIVIPLPGNDRTGYLRSSVLLDLCTVLSSSATNQLSFTSSRCALMEVLLYTVFIHSANFRSL
jgi:hypothetical protein